MPRISAYFLVLWLCITHAATAQERILLKQDTSNATIGDSSIVQIIRHQYGNKGLNLLVIHDDENTGVDAALHFIHENGGRLTELQYGGERYIKFTRQNKAWYIDPNGMFTDSGAIRRLKLAGFKPQPQVVKTITQMGKLVLKAYSATMPKYMITLHNNTDSQFTIRSYQQEKVLIKTAKRLYINPDMDADDLVYVTTDGFFEFFKQRKVNVIMEGLDAKNDGSLSKWACLHRVPYINIEIQHGHTEVQYKMLCWVNELLHLPKYKHLLSEQ